MDDDEKADAHVPAAIPGISVFDLDRTITRRPTYSIYLLRAAAMLAPWRLLLVPVALAVMIGHKAGLVDRRRTKERMHALILGPRLARDAHGRVTARFVAGLERGGFRPEALARMRAERLEGRLLVLATAAPDHYAGRIAQALGMDAVLATPSTWRDGHLTPEIAGDNCAGPAKSRAIRAWLAANAAGGEGAHTRFFSDNLSDVPTFSWVDEAVAINPVPRLRREAVRNGWRIARWR